MRREKDFTGLRAGACGQRAATEAPAGQTWLTGPARARRGLRAVGVSVYSMCLAALIGCGGGSGAGTSSAAPPTVKMSAAKTYVPVNAQIALTWSSSNTTSCSAMGAWSGGLAVTGSQTLAQSKAGVYDYTINCVGAQGSASATVRVVVDNVLASSYANKTARGVGPVTLPPGISGNFAVGDFFQTGTDGLVVHTLVYNPNDPTTYTNYGKIYFFQNVNGAWVDKTSTLLSNSVGCLHPRKAIVADFNNDGIPDVFFACHGADAPPYPGEHPHLLLSQADGTYANVTLPITCFCHSASAADINGDGYPDVLVVDTTVARTPYFLINNKDGSFTPDQTRLPTSLLGEQIFTAELIDFSGTGHYDVFLAGDEPGTAGANTPQGPVIFPNDGTGNYVKTTPVNLMLGTPYGLTLDIVFTGSDIYLLKVNPPYTANQIQKIGYPGLGATTLFTSNGPYANGLPWVDWIIPYQGNIDSENAGFGLSVAQ